MWLTPKGRREFVKAHDRGIAPALLQTADVVLAEPGKLGQLLLRQAFSCLIRLTFRPTSLRMSMRPRSADNDPVIYPRTKKRLLWSRR